jgi:hypothetical protein
VRNTDDAIEYLENRKKELLRQVAKIDRALIELAPDPEPIRSSPISAAIREFLAANPSPQCQNDIIRVVGERRRATKPYDVWKSLQYQVQHKGLIECVDPGTLAPVALKPLPARVYGKNGGERPNTPELYEAENWFVLKKEVSGTQVDSESQEGQTQPAK